MIIRLAPSSSTYFKKNTRWAIDTAFGKSPSVNVVMYAFTHPGGVPRTNPSQTNQSIPDPPNEPVAPLVSTYPGHIQFIDFEFKFNSRPAIDDSLEKICLARLIQLGIGASVQQSAVSAPLMTLINALPDARLLWNPGVARIHGSLCLGGCALCGTIRIRNYSSDVDRCSA